MCTRWGAMLLTAGLCLLGCNRGPTKYPVTGSVSWQGEPIANGDIIFYPEDASRLPEAGKILNGRYEMKVTAGRKTVQLFASRLKLVENKAMGTGEREQIFPADYNAKSKLTVEITAGTNQANFHLPRND